MSKVCFLFDEDVSHDVIAFLRSAEPAIDLLVVGEPSMLPKQTPDQVVYETAVALKRTLVSGDRNTMGPRVTADLQAGGHNSGVIFTRQNCSVARTAGDLHLIWFCETAEDWIDRTDYIPY